MKGRNAMSPEEFCPIRHTIRLLGKRWTILIIKEIYYSKGKKLGFMDLKRELMNVSTKVLSQRLKELVKDGMIKRKVRVDATPIRVHYSLTPKGNDTCDIVTDLKKYGLKWGGKGTFDCEKIDCELCAKKREDSINS